MKKITALILAMTMIFCLCLASCSDNASENKDTATDSEFAAYYANLEAAVEEFKPKTELDKEVLATINGLPISAAAVKYTTWVLPTSNYSEEEIKAEKEMFYTENAALLEVAYDNDIELSEEDKTTIKANITALELQLGENYATEFANSAFTEFFYYFQTSVYPALYNNLYEKILADRENEMTKTSFEEAKSGMVRAKHILIQFPAGEGENGALTDEQKASVLAEAEAVLAEVNAMADISDFDELIEKYNDDPGMTANPDGYYFGKGEMVPEFEESAFSLEEGKTSGLVETSYGYHILLKLPLEDDEAIYNSNAFGNIFGTKLYESISAKAENMEIVYAENHDARVADFAKEYDDTMARLKAEADAEADAAETAE